MTAALASIEVHLAHGLGFADLYDRAGLRQLDALFLEHLSSVDAALAAQLLAARSDPDSLPAREHSDL